MIHEKHCPMSVLQDPTGRPCSGCEAIRAEREDCAKVVDRRIANRNEWNGIVLDVVDQIAASIRARKP